MSSLVLWLYVGGWIYDVSQKALDHLLIDKLLEIEGGVPSH